jgi:protein-tyrosine phosphatase
MAEGILREKVKDRDLEIEIDSAGTGNYHVGEAPDPRSIATTASFGIDISDLRARQFKVSDFDNFDHILVMDESNKANVLKLARNLADESKVKLMLDYASEKNLIEVPDPWFGGEDGFYDVYHMLNDACENFLTVITTK